MTQADALTQLKTLTSQTSNFTFTDDELNQGLQTAWNDTYVVSEVWDSTLTFSPGVYEYNIPSGVTTVRDLYYKRTSTDPQERISPALYEVINGQIKFREDAQNWLQDTYAIYVKGWYKLQSTDSLSTTNLVNYVIWHAAEILLSNLMFKKAFFFLKTDTNMSDIARALQVAQGNTLRYKQGLLRTFESA